MKPELRIILALSFSLAACSHSKPELFLDQTTTALACGSANARDCVPESADAGAHRPAVDECYGDGDCEYGEVCERRHGVSSCQPADGHHGDDDGYAGHGGDDSSSDDDDYGGDDSSSDDDDYGHGGHGADAGAPACAPAYAADDHPKGSDDCYRDDEGDEDRSGSNSGPH